ncbi:MAG: YihY/virulence factor BrkB family protein [Spirochaetes bacterium]|nr:YihY/virulence factor BrkB family protein [Spirochaetota bacterium]
MKWKKQIKKRVAGTMGKARGLVRNICHGGGVFPGMLGRIIKAAKVLIVAGRKFIRDDCPTEASSITYTLILSLVPALTVALSFYSLYYGMGQNRKELFDSILLFMTEHNIKINIDPIFDAILGLIENAGKIGGISAAVMIFSATAMLRTMEKSMNRIWKVRQGRPIFLKIVYYWAALTLGPIMLAAGMTVATQLSAALSSPSYNAGAVNAEGRLWVVGDRSTLLETETGKIRLTGVTADGGRIDLGNQRIYSYDYSTATFTEQDLRLEPVELKKIRYRDVQFIGTRGWIAGTDGMLLITDDGGITWQLHKFGSINFNAIRMVSDTRGFIAAEGGIVMTTADGGASWEAQEWEGRPNFYSIAFYREKGIITGSRGTILTTADGGKTWEQSLLDEAKRHNRPENIYCAFFIDESRIWLTGGDGLLLHSDDGGLKWKARRFDNNAYYTAWFYNPEEGIVGGENGAVIRTGNGGASWERRKMPAMRINQLMYRNNRLWAIGDTGTIMASTDRGGSWETITKGKNFGYTIINFLAPFGFIWLLFLIAYITLPNIKVPFRPAAIGASFTAAVWVIFILLFIVYVRGFAQGTFAIYGALAAIPLFLIMVHASSMIMLFGAEVSYTLVHPESYRSLKTASRDRDDLHVYYGIMTLMQIYHTFERGGGATSLKALQKGTGVKTDQIERYLELLINSKIILQNGDQEYLPANSPKNMKLNRVIDAIMHISLDMPVTPGKSRLRHFLDTLFKQIAASRKKAVGDLTVKDLLDRE